MKKQTDSTSFKIGETFEDYIQNVIFTKESYDLIHRTNNFKQNSERYSEESKRPDFKFRCKITNQEFYVEAKFRSKFNSDDKLHILDIGQYNRYKEIDKVETPVLIAIGYEGSASNPSNLSLIRIEKIEYLDLYKSVLKKYEIDKKTYDNDLLKLYIKEATAKKIINKPIQHEQTVNPEHISNNGQPKKNNRNRIILSLILLFLISTTFYFFTSNDKNDSKIIDKEINSNAEQNIKEYVAKYYLALDNNNVEALDYFINNKVDRWFSKSNVSLTNIKKDTKKYLEKYPYRETKIKWETFKFSELPNEDYNVSYSMIYKIKSNIDDDFKQYNLNIKTIWSHNMKIKNMYEERTN